MSVSHNLTKADIKRRIETVNEFIPAEQGNKTPAVRGRGGTSNQISFI